MSIEGGGQPLRLQDNLSGLVAGHLESFQRAAKAWSADDCHKIATALIKSIDKENKNITEFQKRFIKIVKREELFDEKQQHEIINKANDLFFQAAILKGDFDKAKQVLDTLDSSSVALLAFKMQFFYLSIEKYNLTQLQRFALAQAAAKMELQYEQRMHSDDALHLTGVLCQNIHRFKLAPDQLLAIVKILAATSYPATLINYVGTLGFTNDQLFELAKTLTENGNFTPALIKYPFRFEEEQRYALLKICVEKDSYSAEKHFKDFQIKNPQQRFDMALVAIKQSDLLYPHLHKFELDIQQLIQLAETGSRAANTVTLSLAFSDNIYTTDQRFALAKCCIQQNVDISLGWFDLDRDQVVQLEKLKADSQQKSLPNGYARYFYAIGQLSEENFSIRARITQAQQSPAKEKMTAAWCFEPTAFPHCIRRVRIIVDAELIRYGLREKEIKEAVSPYPSQIEQEIGKENMLIAPHSKHMLLRKPLENTFSKQSIGSYCAPFIIKAAIKNLLEATNEWDEFLSAQGGWPNRGSPLRIASSVVDAVMDNPEKGVRKALSEAKERRAISESEEKSTLKLIKGAGEETTRRTLTFLCKMLSNHPEVVKEIKAEWRKLCEVHPVHNLQELERNLLVFALGGEISGEKCAFSQWLNAAVKETLRLYPAVAEVRRIVEKGCVLNGEYIEEGEVLAFAIMEAQRNAEEWPNPNSFDVSRFLGATKSLWQSHNPLLNFSIGSKKCLGQELTKLELLLAGALYAIFATRELPAAAISSVEPAYAVDRNGFLDPLFPNPLGVLKSGLGLWGQFPAEIGALMGLSEAQSAAAVRQAPLNLS